MGENNISVKRVIIDMDPGYDDAWALQMLLQAEKKLSNIKIMAIICCNGNTSVHNSAINTIKILKAANRIDVSFFIFNIIKFTCCLYLIYIFFLLI